MFYELHDIYSSAWFSFCWIVEEMEGCLTTDARRDTFDYHVALKFIYDELVRRDVQAMKFLCTEFIPRQKMEKLENALDIFSELTTRRKIFPPDNVLLVAELLYCLRQQRLFQILPHSCRDVGESVEGGRSQLHPCRILLHRICEDITEENFRTLKFLCTDISKSAMEKICGPHDLILALEKQGSIGVAKTDLRYLRRILSEAKLEELVFRVDRFSFTGSLINRDVGSCQFSASNNLVANLCVNTQGVSPPNKPLSECIHSARGHQNMDPPGDQFAVPNLFSNHQGVYEGQPRMEMHPYSVTVDTHQEESDLPSYSMTRRPRGICLIFNNKTFYKDENDSQSRQLKVRNGTEIDCELLEKMFGQKLDFKVVVCQDLSDSEICEELAATASKDHSNFDCFVCCILSHGENGAIYGANGKLVQIKQITSYFRPSRCQSLCSKPKLFFIQACQGKEHQRVSDIVTDGPIIPEVGSGGDCMMPRAEGGHLGGSGVMPTAEAIPDEADFLLALATVPGYVSYRSRRKGTWYITTLVKMLEQLADSCDLLSILTRVNAEISRAEELLKGVVCKQVAMPMFTLRKQVRFHQKK